MRGNRFGVRGELEGWGVHRSGRMIRSGAGMRSNNLPSMTNER